MSEPSIRLRHPPEQRFTGRERCFDLQKAFSALPTESMPRSGHMQKALYRCGGATTAIFTFEQGAGLEPYRAEAEAILHVIQGRLRVSTDAGTHELTANQILIVDPDVPQRMKALEETHLLVTIVRAPDGSPD